MNLQNLNLLACVTHFVLAIGFLCWFIYLNNKYPNDPVKGIELSLREHVLELSAVDDNSDITAAWLSNMTTDVNVKNIQYLLVGFFVITGCFHLFYYLSGKKKDGAYNQVIQNQNNYFRWIEYSITSTIMLFIIAMTSGVKDMNIYYSILVSNLVMIMLGQTVETAVRDKKDWKTPMIGAFLLLVTNFFIIIRNLWQRLDQVNQFLTDHPNNVNVDGKTIPSWIKYMVFVMFFFYASFGFLSLYGAYTGKEYPIIEKGYIILSLVSKAQLGAFIAYGLGQRQQST